MPSTEANKEFFEAIRGGRIDEVRRMIEGDASLLEAVDENGLGPFTVARYSRQDAMASWLLDKGVKLDVFAAAMSGRKERLAELIEADGSLVASYSHDGWTPLHLASFFGHDDCVAILLAHGADFHARSRNAMSNTPLHAASAGQKTSTAALLIERGADANARQQGGFTPLHSSAQNGDVATAKLLLEHGAGALARADNNQSPLDLALTKGHQEMVDLLEAQASGAGA